MSMNVKYRDGGVLECNSIKFDGHAMSADDIYQLTPDDVDEIVCNTPSKEPLRMADIPVTGCLRIQDFKTKKVLLADPRDGIAPDIAICEVANLYAEDGWVVIEVKYY